MIHSVEGTRNPSTRLTNGEAFGYAARETLIFVATIAVLTHQLKATTSTLRGFICGAAIMMPYYGRTYKHNKFQAINARLKRLVFPMLDTRWHFRALAWGLGQGLLLLSLAKLDSRIGKFITGALAFKSLTWLPRLWMDTWNLELSIHRKDSEVSDGIDRVLFADDFAVRRDPWPIWVAYRLV